MLNVGECITSMSVLISAVIMCVCVGGGLVSLSAQRTALTDLVCQ